MNQLFLAITLIAAGGIFALLFHKTISAAKIIAITCTTGGALLGLPIALTGLFRAETYTAHWSWSQITLSFQLDSVSAFFLLPILIIAPLVSLYSFHYLGTRQKPMQVATNYFFLSLLNISMVLVACANDIITFVLAWEIMSLSSFFLVMYDYEAKETRRAGYMYFIFTQGGAMFLFAAFGLIYSYTGSFSFASISSFPDTVTLIVFILAFIGFGSKAGVFPLHIWLPHAHPAAPSHISAVMSGVMIKMGIYGIIRIYMLLDTSSLVISTIVLIIGLITGVLGVVYALGQRDLKKLLAYSSVENIGIILIGIGIGMLGVSTGNQPMAFFGFAGGLLHVCNHSIFKSLLFMGAGLVIKQTGTGAIEQLGGLLKRMKITGSTFLTGSLAISGLPPFNGFISEFLIYYGAFNGIHTQKSFILCVTAIVSLAVIGGLAAACFTRVIGVVFLGEPRSEKAAAAVEGNFSMQIPMLLLAAACLLIGVLPRVFVQTAFQGLSSMKMVTGYEAGPFLTLTSNISMVAGLFLTVLVVVMALRKILYRRKQIDSGPTWGCGFSRPTARMQYTGTSYAAEIIDFYRPFVPVLEMYTGIKKIFPGRTSYKSEVEDLAEKTMLKALVRPLLWFFDLLRWIQHGNIQLYIGYIVLAIIALLLFI